MNHSHSHTHSHGHVEKMSHITVAFLLNFGFSILEIFGGIITGSTAILSDAVHDLGDSLSLGFSYLFEQVGKRPANEKYTYGYKRLSLVGAFINIIVLSAGTLFVFKEALQALSNPKVVQAQGMLVLGIIGIIVNGLSVFRMKGSKKILDQSVMMHLLEDLLGWIAVLVVSIIIYFTNWYILDPILSLVIGCIIVRNIVINFKSAIKILMQAVPDKEVSKEIKEHLLEMKEVESIEQFNMWTMDGEMHIVTASLTMVKGVEKSKVLAEIKEMLRHEGIRHSTIEMI